MTAVEQAVLSVVVACCVLVCVYDVEGNPVSKRLHSRAFRYRRLATWVPLGLTYALFYATRYSITAGNVPLIRAQLGFSTADFGVVFTAGFWTYAVSAPFTGALADKIGGKMALLLSASGACAANALLGWHFSAATAPESSPSLALFAAGYATNIFFQGFGTAAMLKINAALYDDEERGTFGGLFNVLLTSGYYFALAVCPRIAKDMGWHFVFFVPSAGLGMCVLLLIVAVPADAGVKRTPASCPLKESLSTALPAGQGQAVSATEPAAEPSFRNLLLDLAKSPTFPFYVLAIMCCSWVRDGLLTWMYSFLNDEREFPLDSTAHTLLGAAVTFGGFCGGIACGAVSDYCFSRRRIPPVLLFTALQIVALVAFYVMRQGSIALLASLVFLICVFLLGNYTLLSYTVPGDLPAGVVGTACGILTAAGYIASGFSGIVLGSAIQALGYLGGWFATLLVASGLGLVLVLVAFLRGSRAGTLVQALELPASGGLDASTTELRTIHVEQDPYYGSGGSSAVAPQSPVGVPQVTVLGGGDLVPNISVGQAAVRTAGIQDENLLQHWSSGTFFQWFSAGEVADRLAWRIAGQQTSASSIALVEQTAQSSALTLGEGQGAPVQTPAMTSADMLHVGFLSRRANDPTSYFGNAAAKAHRHLLPY